MSLKRIGIMVFEKKIIKENEQLLCRLLKRNVYLLEQDDGRTSKALDFSGIDGFIEYKGGVQPMACRISHSDSNLIGTRYDRSNGVPTEYEKTLKAIREGTVYARIGIHIFLSNGKVTKVIEFDRWCLFRAFMCIENLAPLLTERLKGDGVRFLNVSKYFMEAHKVPYEIHIP